MSSKNYLDSTICVGIEIQMVGTLLITKEVQFMYNINDFSIRNDSGELLDLSGNIVRQLEDDMYHASDEDGISLTSIYWAADEGGLVYSHNDTPKAKFIIEHILAAILN